MKRSFLIIAVIFGMVLCSAQTTKVQQYEFELWGGATTPLGGYHGGDNKIGATIGLALRQNFSGTPWDCGLFMQLDCAQRDYWGTRTYNQNNRTLSIGVLGSYNFRQGKKINPFASMGIGIAIQDVVGDSHYPSSGVTASFIPKVGVEFLRFFRLNLYCQISRHGYNTAGLTIGFTFGGLPKK